jgi:hypothetical protein
VLVFLAHLSSQRDFLLLLLIFDCILLFFLFLSNVLTTSSVHYCVCITGSFLVVVLVYCSSLSFLSLRENTCVCVFVLIFLAKLLFLSPAIAVRRVCILVSSSSCEGASSILISFVFVFFPPSTVDACVAAISGPEIT